MNRIDHVLLMASYNAAMNASVYRVARQLPAAALSADRKAFFGSILGTLNHLANADLIWLKRIAGDTANYPQLDPVRALPNPAGLGTVEFSDIDSLWERRRWLDELISAWIAALTDADLDHTLHYVNSRGAANKNLFGVLLHFFNHQTHHRGQVSTLLSQEGIDIGVTDLLMWIPDQPAAADPAIQRIAAFSDGEQGGNPAGVWIGAALPPTPAMQAIAAQVGFSETVFAAPEGEGWRVRYFSPESEVPFCGHATIALGAALALKGGDGVFALALNQAGITVAGRRDGATIQASLQSPPTRSSAAPDTLVDQALGLFGYTRDDLDPRIPPALAHAGADHLVLVLNRRAALAAMRYSLDQGRRLMNGAGLVTIVLAWAEHAQLFHTRNPFASGGVYEDPATGAGTAALAGYLRDLGWPH
ncbi:MAG: PhzF family phenazine biosynthesis protein, partial [Massilia sp.]|nr:PhzF family phenazine biosynthesis protein [Massilia sp.]